LEVLVGKTAGMCQGVRKALDDINLILSQNKDVYCIGEFVHNIQIVDALENKGLIQVKSIDDVPNYSNVVFRTHGVAKEVYTAAELKGLNVFDLTCPNVRMVQEKVMKELKRSFIVIVGNESHPEIYALKSFAGEQSFIVDDIDEVADAVIEFEKSGKDYAYVVSQTTFSSKKFDEISDEIRNDFKEANRNAIVMVDKTICGATERRQDETIEIAKQVDAMIIIGGKNSSNTQKLFDISSKYCEKVFFATYKKDLRKKDFEGLGRVGIMAGASTPMETVEEIKEFIEKI
jgi:4-hydroxy-3-methylbut-2-enyl diphosphate reductase